MTFASDAHTVIRLLDQYLEQSSSGEAMVIRQDAMAQIHQDLDLDSWVRTGGLEANDLAGFVKTYLSHTTRLHHPGFMAHQVGVPHPTGALGALIDGITNNAMAIYEMGPAAAAIEFFMVNRLLEKIGWPAMPLTVADRLGFDHGGGVLTHGGSLANLTALLAARNHLDPAARTSGNTRDMIILAPASTHYSIVKTAGIIGLGETNVWPLDTDDLGRIRTDRLKKTVDSARQSGKRVAALVANACATGTGLYDALDDIGTFCHQHRIWFHVDGAHGACALFSPQMAPFIQGIHKASSVVLDAHKMLRTPNLCAALLVRHAEPLDLVFETKASYLFHDKYQPGFDFIQQTVECTKAGLGLKFFLSMAAMGETGLARYLDQAYDLTQNAWAFIHSQKDFSCPCQPESNILCFRLNGPDRLQIAIRDELIRLGRFYVSSTEINQARYLRLVIISPNTTLADIRDLVSDIRDIGHRLSDT